MFLNSFAIGPNGKDKFCTTGATFALFCKRRDRQYGIYLVLATALFLILFNNLL
jgi:hypothetical protein